MFAQKSLLERTKIRTLTFQERLGILGLWTLSIEFEAVIVLLLSIADAEGKPRDILGQRERTRGTENLSGERRAATVSEHPAPNGLLKCPAQADTPFE